MRLAVFYSACMTAVLLSGSAFGARPAHAAPQNPEAPVSRLPQQVAKELSSPDTYQTIEEAFRASSEPASPDRLESQGADGRAGQTGQASSGSQADGPGGDLSAEALDQPVQPDSGDARAPTADSLSSEMDLELPQSGSSLNPRDHLYLAANVQDVTLESLSSSPVLPTVDPALEPRVQKMIKFYQTQAHSSMQQVMRNRAKVAPVVLVRFADAGIPLWVANIAVVESGFNPRARSSSGPAGLWQLQAATARHLGLRVGGGVDERFDPVKSTDAVVKLLNEHYRAFGDWHLAIAAYAAGQDRVQRALRAHPNATVVELVEKGLLSRSILHTIATVHASSRIIEEPVAHGFKGMSREPSPDIVAETRRAMEAVSGGEPQAATY